MSEKGFVTGEEYDIICTLVRLFHPSTPWRSVGLRMRKEIWDLPYLHTSDKGRSKDKRGTFLKFI